MKKLSAVLLIGLVCVIGISYAFLQKSEKESNITKKSISKISQSLKELNQSFKYKGKYIHPRAIKDLTAWVGDREPGPVAIDVTGTYESNRYFGDYRKLENGVIFVDLEQEYLEDTGWFSYKYLERFANGLHVLRTFDNGRGTGVFQEILLLEAKVDFEYDSDGKKIEKLILQRRGSYGIGDRYDGKITVNAKENKITVGIDKRNFIDKEFIIKLDKSENKDKSSTPQILNLKVENIEIGTKYADVLKKLGKPSSSKKGREFPCDDEGEVRILRYKGLVFKLIENYDDKNFFVASTTVKSDKWLVMNSRDGKTVKIGASVGEVKEMLGDGKLIREEKLDALAYYNTDGYARFYFKDYKLIKITWEINLC